MNFLRPLSLTCLILLGACAEETATAPSTGTAQAAAQGATPGATPSAGQPAPQRLSLKGCTSDRVHFRVSGRPLAVPLEVVRNISPAATRPGTPPDQITQQILSMLDNGTGCPGKPMDANIVVLETAVSNPLLSGQIALQRKPSDEAVRGYANLTRQLQERKPEQNCRAAAVDLVGCYGSQRTAAGGGPVGVLFLITTNPQQNLATGGPLTARCAVGEDRTVQNCSVIDVVDGVMIEAELKSGRYSTAALRAARDAAVEQVSRFRL